MPAGKAETAAANALRVLFPVVAVLPDGSDDVFAKFLLPSLQHADVRGMRRGEVIGVRAILELKLPVCLVSKGHLPWNQFHTFVALIRHEIEQLGRLAEIVSQGWNVGDQTAEKEPPIILEARKH